MADGEGLPGSVTPTTIAGYPVRVEKVRVADQLVPILVVADLERYVDRDALLRDADGPEPPYWAHLWTASRVLARIVAEHDNCNVQVRVSGRDTGHVPRDACLVSRRTNASHRHDLQVERFYEDQVRFLTLGPSKYSSTSAKWSIHALSEAVDRRACAVEWRGWSRGLYGKFPRSRMSSAGRAA